MRLRWGLLLVLGALLPASAGADPVPGQITVSFAPTASRAQRAEVAALPGLAGGQQIAAIHALLLRVPPGREADWITRIRRMRGVAAVQQPGTLQASTADTYWNRQWALQNNSTTYHRTSWVNDADIDAPEAWSVSLGPWSRVAVLDSGVDQNHPDLSSRLAAQANFSASATVDDLYGHGTGVAGVIAALRNNSMGIAGLTPNAYLLNGKVLDDNGNGSTAGLANAIVWASQSGAQVISISLVSTSADVALENAVNYATSRGALVICSAGNGGTSTPVYPAYYPNAIAVASTDATDMLAASSGRGSWVDIAAPGVDIYSTAPNHTNRFGVLHYGWFSGASFATPQVAGVAALVSNRVRDSNGNGLTSDELRTRVLGSADRLLSLGQLISGGRLNACRAMTAWSSC